MLNHVDHQKLSLIINGLEKTVVTIHKASAIFAKLEHNFIKAHNSGAISNAQFAHYRKTNIHLSQISKRLDQEIAAYSKKLKNCISIK